MKGWWTKVAVVAAFAIIGLVAGCSDDDNGTGPDLTSEFDDLVTYLDNNDLDLPTLMSGWTISAQALFDAGPENYFIIDIRTTQIDSPKFFQHTNVCHQIVVDSALSQINFVHDAKQVVAKPVFQSRRFPDPHANLTTRISNGGEGRRPLSRPMGKPGQPDRGSGQR